MSTPIKIIMVGDPGSGKTTACWEASNSPDLLKCMGIFAKAPDNKRAQHLPTIGVEVHSLNVLGTKVNVWDCAGIETNKDLFGGYYIDADAVIIVSDHPRNYMPGVQAYRNIQLQYIICSPHEIPVNVFSVASDYVQEERSRVPETPEKVLAICKELLFRKNRA